LKNLSALLPWVPELFRDFTAILPADLRPGEEGYIWCLGERRADLARALAQTPPTAAARRIVLIGDDRGELFTEREELRAPCMGFLRDIHTPGWSKGLPRPAAAIAASFCVSRLSPGETGAFLQEVCASLAAGGVFFWIDFFLPQSLSLLAQYQKALAAHLDPGAVDEKTFNDLLRSRNLMLPEAAMPLLAQSGFGNMEIPAKRMLLAAIAAYK
jgi:hypothetical protein